MIPSTMFIEMGLGLIQSRDPILIRQQLIELNSFGIKGFDLFKQVLYEKGITGLMDREVGYLLGIETTRAMYFNFMENKVMKEGG